MRPQDRRERSISGQEADDRDDAGLRPAEAPRRRPLPPHRQARRGRAPSGYTLSYPSTCLETGTTSPDCIDFIDYRPYLNLRSRIVWYQPSRLAQGRISYTNNYDVICYFIKGDRPNTFNLDAIRVPQLVELDHRLRCERVPSVRNGKYGKTRFNENGKNPGDVWGDIKQLTYKSKELVSRDALNTIQKPEQLIERLVHASSREGDLVLDPFAGVGTCPAVCKRLGRRFIGIERDAELAGAARTRMRQIEADLAARLL